MRFLINMQSLSYEQYHSNSLLSFLADTVKQLKRHPEHMGSTWAELASFSGGVTKRLFIA